MATITNLDTMVAQAINDPNHNEVAAVSVAGSDMLRWINQVCLDASILTDCLQTSGTITGTGVESYTLPSPASEGYRLQVLLTTLAGSTITVTVAGGGGAVVVAAAGGGGTTTTMAEAIAVQLDALVGVGAYSDGTYIYVFSTNSLTINSITTNAAASMLTIDNGSALYWRTLSVVDRTNGRKYLPVPRDQYQDHYIAIVSNLASGLYVYNIFGYGSSRLIYVLPLLASGNLTIEYSVTHPTIVYTNGTETPSGILNQYDRLVVEGVRAIYYQTVGDETQAQMSFVVYMDWIKRLAREVGTNPSIDPEMSSIYRQFYKAIKAVKES